MKASNCFSENKVAEEVQSGLLEQRETRKRGKKEKEETREISKGRAKQDSRQPRKMALCKHVGEGEGDREGGERERIFLN